MGVEHISKWVPIVMDGIASGRYAGKQGTRCLKDIESGLWTQEREEHYQSAYMAMGRVPQPMGWLDEVIARHPDEMGRRFQEYEATHKY